MTKEKNVKELTKQEIINEAWCNQCLDKIDENGWVNLGYCVNGIDDVECWLSDNFFKRNLDKWEINYSELDNGEIFNTKIRPKSLQGVEDNAGWIKIESEDDLPKEEKDYWVVDSDGEVFICFFDTDYKAFEGYFHYDQKGKITHYRLIEKPKPPLY